MVTNNFNGLLSIVDSYGGGDSELSSHIGEMFSSYEPFGILTVDGEEEYQKEWRENNDTRKRSWHSKLEDKDDMVRLTLIYFLECGLLDKKSQVSIDIQHLSMTEDLEYFNEYAWGLESYNATISSMHRVLPLHDAELNESATYSLTNEDYPIPPIPPPKKHKRRRKEAIDTENAKFVYYQQQDTSNNDDPSFENVGQQAGSSHEVDDELRSAIHSLDIKADHVVDCGVFMLKAMEYLLAKQEFNFSHGGPLAAMGPHGWVPIGGHYRKVGDPPMATIQTTKMVAIMTVTWF
ncbi:hypothetical protein FNV43_RR11087 [Rhamnella rubrinervis]|uniref:DUF1985 domain-containing protein n=1 Tax=Rhamnella rubrinervis TaxID=2594499 RepID=A0A8K0MHI8_9ROSA|nr:hypothetical protein FNV43_RR11087 [Rhamnella rubrinervis]